MAEVKWTTSQEEAIRKTGSNILVSAAAGSGKTAVLVERVIRMLVREENPLDLDRLLVMTFTRAAAAQMKSKIYNALRDYLKLHPDNIRLRNQLMKVQSARICTIDSLCSEIVREHFQEIEIDPGFRIPDEAEIRLLKKDVLSLLLEEKYAEGKEDFLNFAEYYTDRNDKKLEDLILTLHRFSESHPEPSAWLSACNLPYLRAENLFSSEDCADYPEGMDDWMGVFAGIVNTKLEEVLQMSLEGIRISEENQGPYAYAGLFREIAEFTQEILGQSFDNRVYMLRSFLADWKRLPSISKKDTDVDEEKKELAADLRKEIKKELEELRDQFLYEDLEEIFREMARCAPVAKTLTDLTRQFDLELTKAKEARLLADFSDIAHYALKVLIQYDENGVILRDSSGQPLYTRTADALAGSLDEVIVDEYQDTNMLQEYLIRALSQERFGNPNVFMVGDVKQSIYGFRMACPELFNEKLELYKDPGAGALIFLDRNFRSRKEILDFTNLVFEKAMIREVGGIAYSEGHALVCGREEDSSPVPEILFLNGSKEQGRFLEAYKIAERIERFVTEDHFRFSDIVILTRTSDNPQLEQVLYERGIPVLKNSGKGFFDSFEIRLVMDLLSIIDNPFQDIPFAAVLYSPLLNASADELARIRLSGTEKDSLFACLQKYEEDGRFAGFLEKLALWRRKAADMGICDFLEYVLSDSGMDTILYAMPEGDNRRSNVEFLKSKARSFARSSYSGLYHFVRYIKELKENDVDFGSVNAISSQAEAVRMMTIHKSKGLEFPVVILALCGKTYNRTDMNASVIPDRNLGLGLELRDPESRLVKKTAFMQTVRQKQKAGTFAEESRLLYVALTRARERLVVVGTDSHLENRIRDWNRKTGTTAALSPRTLLSSDSYLKVIGASAGPLAGEDPRFLMQTFEETDVEEERVSEIMENAILREQILSLAEQETDIKALEDALGFRYPFEKAAHMLGKITASQLENKPEAATFAKETAGEEDEKKAGVTKKAENLEGAERGSAYHRFFEILEYENLTPDQDAGQLRAQILSQIEKFRDQGSLSPEYVKTVDPDKIVAFLHSPIGARMRKAAESGLLFREKQFVLGYVTDINHEKTMTGEQYHSDVPDEELLLVQGIIDAWFIEETKAPAGSLDSSDRSQARAGNQRSDSRKIILVDYKTDKNSDEQHYIDVYSPQLNAYADALERSLHLPAAEKIIYSLELGRGIRLP